MTDDSAITTIAIAVVREGDRFLIGKRAADVPLANYWEFPGGKVRTNETPADAAIRECREETGLEVHLGDLLAEVEHTYSHGRLRLYFYDCTPLDPAGKPAAPFCWVPRCELDRYQFPEANRTLIAQLVRHDRPRQ